MRLNSLVTYASGWRMGTGTPLGGLEAERKQQISHSSHRGLCISSLTCGPEAAAGPEAIPPLPCLTPGLGVRLVL